MSHLVHSSFAAHILGSRLSPQARVSRYSDTAHKLISEPDVFIASRRLLECVGVFAGAVCPAGPALLGSQKLRWLLSVSVAAAAPTTGPLLETSHPGPTGLLEVGS